MAYTSENLTAVENAIIALATGARVVKVTLNNKTIEYSEASLPQLKKLKAEITADLSTSTRPRLTRISTSKGL